MSIEPVLITLAAHLLANNAASGPRSPILVIGVVALIVVIVLTVSIYRLRRGGPGPAVNWVPRGLRGRVNRNFDEHGWQKPYDDDGNRNPDRKQL